MTKSYHIVFCTELWLPIVVAAILTPICIGYAMGSADVGEGHFLATKAIFPYTVVAVLVFKSVPRVVLIASLCELPVYGVIVGYCLHRRRYRPILWLVIAHVVASAMVIMFNPYELNG